MPNCLGRAPISAIFIADGQCACALFPFKLCLDSSNFPGLCIRHCSIHSVSAPRHRGSLFNCNQSIVHPLNLGITKNFDTAWSVVIGLILVISGSILPLNPGLTASDKISELRLGSVLLLCWQC